MSQCFVISDIHLANPAKSNFFDRDAEKELVLFLDWVLERSRRTETTLVLNGDSFDYLYLENARAFVPDSGDRLKRTVDIVRENHNTFAALARLAKAGIRIVFLPGNHDLELFDPACQREVAGKIGGDVEFRLPDAELIFKDACIRHGNGQDLWNWVDYPRLHQYYTRRGSPLPQVPQGSQLVTTVLAEHLPRYPYIQLLEPESLLQAVLVSVDEASKIDLAATAIRFKLQEILAKVSAPGNLQERIAVPARARADAALRLIPPPNEKISAPDQGITARGDARLKEIFATQVERIRDANDYAKTSDAEIALAETIVRQRPEIKTVVLGHTHLPKMVSIAHGTSRLINTGTWGRGIVLPEELFSPDPDVSQKARGDFWNSLMEKRLLNYARPRPHFAWLKSEDGKSASVALCSFDGQAIQVGG